MTNGYVFDIEADNLYLESNTIWVIHCISLDGERQLSFFPFKDFEKAREDFLEFHKSFGDSPLVVSHNGLGYDHWMLWKHLNIPFHVGKGGGDYLDDEPCRFFDTFLASQFVDPDRQSHALASYGEQFNDLKIEFNDYSKYCEEMLTYCIQDVKLTLKTYNYLVNKIQSLYIQFYRSDYNKQYESVFKSMQKDYYLYSAQSFTGIKFNQTAAKELVETIAIEMQEIEDEVLPQLPPRGLKETEKLFYRLPAKPFNMSGQFSANMHKWIEKHNAKVIDGFTVEVYGKTYPIESRLQLSVELPMEIADGNDIKNWFMSKGWEPEFWNLKKDTETNKPIRDAAGQVIKTTPKIQEAGKICPNLLELDGELPRKIVKFLSLRNRQAVVNGWLQNPRLEFDGRLSASITGYTPTFRVKHSNIVNLPKASPDVLKGYEVRSLFKASLGMQLTSADAASLEDRCIAVQTIKFDGGTYAEQVLKGDSHSAAAKVFYPDETKEFDITSKEFNKDDPKFKPFRARAKNGGFALKYGCTAKKLAKVLGLSENRGVRAYDNFWEFNAGLGKLKESLETEWSTKGMKKYIQGVDGRILTARSKHLLINLKSQNLGATIITYAACLMDNKLGWLQIDKKGRPYYEYNSKIVKRLSAVHDEINFETEPEVSKEIGQMIVDCIKKAGELLKLEIAFDGEYKVGGTLANVH